MKRQCAAIARCEAVTGHYRFYEKVVKVKDDVAAILNSFPRAIIVAPGQPAGVCTSAEANRVGTSSLFPYRRRYASPRVSVTAYALIRSKISFPEISGSTHSCRASIRTLNELL